MDQVPNIPNINQYHTHFNQTAPYIKSEPRPDRGCNDKCCYGLFIFFTLLLIGAGIFFIVKADFSSLTKQDTTKTTTATTTNDGQAYDIQNLKPGIPVIIGMCVFAVILSVLFLCLIIKFPKCMFYTMLVFGALLILALAIILFIALQFAAGVIFLVVFLAYILAIYCGRDKIRVGTVLLQTAAKFVTEKPTIFLAPFVIIILMAGFQLFWLVSFVAITIYGGFQEGTASDTQQTTPEQNVSGAFIIIWGFLQLFYSFFFHYCIVFLIATAAAMWYYNVDGNYLCTSLKRIISSHLGSFTFAALIMALVTMARQAAENQRNQNQGGMNFCSCLLVCCLNAIEDLVEVLNHNAIIVMAVTGQSYIDSAKSAISIIFQNFMLFFLIDMVSSLVKLAGIIFVAAIPGIIGFFLLRATAENPDDNQFLTYGTVIIVLVSMLIAIIFLSVLSEALSCVFIFYCLDRKFTQLGYPAPQNTPAPMKSLFQQMARSSGLPSNNQLNPPANPYNSRPQQSYQSGNQSGNPYGSLPPY